ncbi:hypothetical protein TgHK011_009606 [Trichoderma gracile]|nr:hypothetical protein TgHK011_009606 [Trichoderma gracile]
MPSRYLQGAWLAAGRRRYRAIREYLRAPACPPLGTWKLAREVPLAHHRQWAAEAMRRDLADTRGDEEVRMTEAVLGR